MFILSFQNVAYFNEFIFLCLSNNIVIRCCLASDPPNRCSANCHQEGCDTCILKVADLPYSIFFVGSGIVASISAYIYRLYVNLKVFYSNLVDIFISKCCFVVLQHFSGLEEAVFRNIRACKELSQTTRTAYGPNGELMYLNVQNGCLLIEY